MIPKIIHYCWFGRNPKPKLTEKCIASWRKFCPDYTLMEWNEDNFDVSQAPEYVRQAYQAKKWAFVTDYVRLKAMIAYGGVYMDTDVELVKPLDGFLKHSAFGGFENPGSIMTGVMACEQGFELFQEFMQYYDDAVFLNPDGSLNVTTNVETVTGICGRYGLVPNGEYQVVAGLALYPSEVFSPVDFETGKLKRTRKTVAIHWFSGSWYSEQERQNRKDARKQAKKEKLLDQARQWLGEEGYARWEERLGRYRSWEQWKKLPVRVVRKLLGKSNAEE